MVASVAEIFRPPGSRRHTSQAQKWGDAWVGGLKTTEKGPHDRGATWRMISLTSWLVSSSTALMSRTPTAPEICWSGSGIYTADSRRSWPTASTSGTGPARLPAWAEADHRPPDRRHLRLHRRAAPVGGGYSVRPDDSDSLRTASNSGSPRGDSHPRNHRHHAAPLRSPNPKALASSLNVETATRNRVAIDHLQPRGKLDAWGLAVQQRTKRAAETGYGL